MTLWRVLLMFVIVAVVTLAVAPQEAVPFGGSDDKLKHFAAFFVVSALACFAFPKARMWVMLTALLAFNAMIEAAQAIVRTGRETDLLDFATGALATCVILLAFLLIRGRDGGALRPG